MRFARRVGRPQLLCACDSGPPGRVPQPFFFSQNLRRPHVFRRSPARRRGRGGCSRCLWRFNFNDDWSASHERPKRKLALRQLPQRQLSSPLSLQQVRCHAWPRGRRHCLRVREAGVQTPPQRLQDDRFFLRSGGASQAPQRKARRRRIIFFTTTTTTDRHCCSTKRSGP